MFKYVFRNMVKKIEHLSKEIWNISKDTNPRKGVQVEQNGN